MTPPARITMDSKVHGTLIRNKDNTEIPCDEFIVFRPADNAVPQTLAFYRKLLIEQHASDEQIAAVEALERRVKNWRQLQPERCHVAEFEDEGDKA